MIFSAAIDSRLILPCLVEAGLDACAAESVRLGLAQILSGIRPSPFSIATTFESKSGPADAALTLDVLWDGVTVSIDTRKDTGVAATLEKFAHSYDPVIQELLRNVTVHELKQLDERLKALNASCSVLRGALAPISLPVAQALIDFHSASVNRVIHEEVVGFMVRTVRDKAARLLLGQFLLVQFPLPAKRTHRFVICQALENLAEPELYEGLSKLALDPQYTSLRGGLCEALARTRHPDAAKTIAAVLDDGDDETKLSAIEALGNLKAVQHADKIRAFVNYQSSDKEWTRAIKKAAEKALKALGEPEPRT